MKKNMMFLLIGVIFVGTGFLAGYFAGSYFLGDNTAEPVPTPVATEDVLEAKAEDAQNVSSQEIVETPEPTYAGVRYLVRLEKNSLCLYEVNGENEKKIKSNNIESNLYPQSDIRELTAGIYTGTLEGGLELLESFVG
jgi:hypothetical protein